MSQLIKEIKQEMIDRVIRLEIYQDDQDDFGSNRFYTMWPHHEECYCCDAIKSTKPPESSDDQIVMWDVFAEKYVTHSISNVGVMSVFVDDDGEYDHERTLQTIRAIKDEINCCCDCDFITCDNQHVEDVILHTRTNVQDHETLDVWNALKSMNLKFDNVHDLKTACDDDLPCVQQEYMNLIRSKRADAFVELDQLEEEAKQTQASEDDLADINTIKQMFRDIPQEADLTQYNTIQELFRFWPSLLLPGPDNESVLSVIEAGDSIKQLVDDDIKMTETLNKGYSAEFVEMDENLADMPDFQLIQVCQVLDQVEDADHLQELLDTYHAAPYTIDDELTEDQRVDLHDNQNCEIKVVTRAIVDAVKHRLSALKN